MCRECTKVSNAKSYKKNPEQKKAQSNAWYAANRERASAYNRKRYLDFPEKRAGKGDWAKRNPELRAIVVAKWAKENPEKVDAARKKWSEENNEAEKTKLRRYRARRKGAEGNHTTEDIEAMLIQQDFKCAVCSADIKEGSERQVDHIMPLVLGGSNWIENIQILCNFCNRSKGGKHPIAFANSLGRLF